MEVYENVNESDVITYMSYDEWERIKNDIDKRQMRNEIFKRRRLARYYKKQRKIGVFTLCVGIISVLPGCVFDVDGVQLFASALMVAGAYMALSKKMLIVDNYFIEEGYMYSKV